MEREFYYIAWLSMILDLDHLLGLISVFFLIFIDQINRNNFGSNLRLKNNQFQSFQV